MSNDKLLSLIIPCYNESGNIPLLVQHLKNSLGPHKEVEIIFVNNGSTDNSQEVFTRELASADISHFRIHNLSVNKGYGYGILSGLKEAKGDVLAWTHADMQTDPEDVLRAFELYKRQKEADVLVKGRRKNRRILESFFTWGMQLVVSCILRTKLSDINAQPKLFSRPFYEKFIKDDAPNDFSLDLYVLYQAQKYDYNIKEIPVDFVRRMHGEAKGGGSWLTRVKLIIRTLKYTMRLRDSINRESD